MVTQQVVGVLRAGLYIVLLQVNIDGRTADLMTSSGLADPLFEAKINGNDVILQVIR